MGDMRNKGTPDRATFSLIILFVGARFVAHPLESGLYVHVESTDGSMNQVDFKKRTKPNDKRLGCIYD